MSTGAKLLELADPRALTIRSTGTSLLVVLIIATVLPWAVQLYKGELDPKANESTAKVAQDEADAAGAIAQMVAPNEDRQPDQINRMLQSLKNETDPSGIQARSDVPIEESHLLPLLTVSPKPESYEYPTTDAPVYHDWANPKTLPVLEVNTPRQAETRNDSQSVQIAMKPIAPAKNAVIESELPEDYPHTGAPPLSPDSFTSAVPPMHPPADYPRASVAEVAPPIANMKTETAEPTLGDTPAVAVTPPALEAPPSDVPPTMQSMGPGETAQLEIDRIEQSLLAEEAARHRAMRMENLAQSADKKTQHAFELAGRGAMFAARREFIESLRMISQGLDAEYKTGRHSRALAEGLRAIEEVDDFMPKGETYDAELNVRQIVEGHITEALKTAPLDRTVPLSAIRSYMTFAQQKLAEAMGTEAAGSMALRGLAKLYDRMSIEQPEAIEAAAAKAMAIYQAALLVRKENYLAANDLGVLLARSGRDAAARDTLKYAASIRRDPIVVANLAALNRRLGESDRAAALAREAANRTIQERRERLAQGDMRDLPARWIDESELVGMPNETGQPNITRTPSAAPTAPAIANPYPQNRDPAQPYMRQNSRVGAQPVSQQTIRPATERSPAHWSGLPDGFGPQPNAPTPNVIPQRTWTPVTNPGAPQPAEPQPWYRSTRFWNRNRSIK